MSDSIENIFEKWSDDLNGPFEPVQSMGSCKLDTDEPITHLDNIDGILYAFTDNSMFRLDGSPETGFSPVKVWDNAN